MKFAIACAVLFFATVVHADTLTTVNGTTVYPDGSVITSETIVVPTFDNGFQGYTEIQFQFQGGSGFALSDFEDARGEFGLIAFTAPVSNLSCAASCSAMTPLGIAVGCKSTRSGDGRSVSSQGSASRALLLIVLPAL